MPNQTGEGSVPALNPALKDALTALAFDDILQDIDNEQAPIWAQASKMDHYWRGNQHLVLDPSGGGVEWVPVGQSSRLRYNRSTGSEATRTYNYVLNLFRGDGRKFIGVVGQRATDPSLAAFASGAAVPVVAMAK